VNNLLLNCRPHTVFDANTKEHRKAYYHFLKFSTWGRSPYQFILEPGFEDIPTLCRHRLCEYYVSKEFAAVKPTLKFNKPNSNKLTVVKLGPKKD
jgi:hypothetical protein